MGTMTTEIQPTRLEDYIKELLPGAHGHQIKAIATFVATIIAKQTGCQAELARTQGNQEAAVKRLSRLLHNERIRPKDFAEWLCRQALEQLPRRSGRCELSLIAAVIALVQQDRCLFTALSPHTKLNLKATLSNVS
jgi:hypothetical protein